jgi:hypothetical protein
MGVEGNGKVVDPMVKGVNGNTAIPRSQSSTAKKSILGSLFSISARYFSLEDDACDISDNLPDL